MRRLKVALAWAALAALSGCASSSAVAVAPASQTAQAQGCKSQLVTELEARGVIFAPSCATVLAPAMRRAVREPVSDYWLPSPSVIEALETRLRPALELGRTKPETLSDIPEQPADAEEWRWGMSGALAQILPHLSEYRRQYVGIVIRGGTTRVLVNFILDEPGRKDEYPDWTERFIDYVDDGDTSFWHIEYDVRSAQFLNFQVNPSA